MSAQIRWPTIKITKKYAKKQKQINNRIFVFKMVEFCCLFAFVSLVRHATDVKHVVAANENIAKVARLDTTNVLFSVC